MIFQFPHDIAAEAARRWQERQPVRAANEGKSSVQIEDQGRIAARMDRLANAASATATINLAEAELPSSDFLHDIGLERVIGENDFQNIAFLQLALAVSRFVGRINIRSNGKTVGYGTGFMVSPRLLMTNNHVLPDPGKAQSSVVEFDYQLDSTGRQLNMMPFALEPRTFFMTDRRLDFTLVAVGDRSSGGRELRLYGWSPLIPQIGKILVGEHVNIIQHPRGNFKSFVSRDNKLVDLLEDHLHYVTDTEPGSSGSPVYNDQWEVVALHHSGVPQMINGRYADIDGGVWNGRDPERIKWIANEGVRISKLVKFINEQRLEGAQAALRDQMLHATPKNAIELALEALHPGPSGTRTISTGAGRVEITIPLKISVELGQPVPPASEAARDATVVQPDATGADLRLTGFTGPEIPASAPAAPVDAATLDSAMLAILSLDWQEKPGGVPAKEADEPFGRYEGLPAKIALLQDGRNAELLEPLTFFEADGHDWPVPKGAKIDGASIPQAFWSIIGGPFEGKYRDASIVHDHYCESESRSWQDTHRVFHAAMRTSGVSAFKAKIMYYAVYRFGPRWADPGGAEAAPLAIARRPLTAADAPTIVADAEAIFAHELSLEEIAHLAEARNLAGADAPAEATSAQPLERARRLVVTGGSGTFEDLEAVAADAATLPGFVMDWFEKKKIRIVACRESVTDFETKLRGKIPRGWEGLGRSWDDVPGTYLNEKRRVVIGTVLASSGTGRAVPGRGSGKHGSISLVVHESLHGFDYSRDHAVLRDAGFLRARQSSLAALDAYQRQPGQAGLEETFAESGARFVAEPQALQRDCPELFLYWQNRPGRQEALAAEAAMSTPETSADSDESAAIGSYVKAADGTVHLDLRAEGPDGIIGHAMLTVSGSGADYDRLSGHLEPSADARESLSGDQEGLVRPATRLTRKPRRQPRKK